MTFFEKNELKLLWRVYLGNLIASSFALMAAFGFVYLLGMGISVTQAGFLFAVMSTGMLFFEIPTGAIADKYGRKFSVLLGSILEGLLFISIFFVKKYVFLLVIFFLFGIVATLHSGSGESWIYDLLKRRNPKLIQNFYAKDQIFGATGLILSGLIGAFIVSKLGIGSIWIFSGLGCFAYFLILLPLEEIHTKKKEHSGKFKEIYKQSRDSVKYATKHRTLFYIFLAAFIIIFSVSFAEGVAIIPYLLEMNFPEHAFGYYFSIMALTMVLAPLTIKYFNTKGRDVGFMIFAVLAGSLFLGISYFIRNYFIAIGILFISFFFFALKYPVERPFLNKFIPSQKRATVLSFQSMLCSLAGIIALPLGGFLVDTFGARIVLVISSSLGVPISWAYWRIGRNKNRNP